MNKLELKVLSSLFLFGISIVLINFLLILPTSAWYVLLILPSLVLSFVIVNWIDKLLTRIHLSQGWLAIITAVIIICALSVFFPFLNPPKAHFPYIVYDGTSQLTEEQYYAINIFDGLDDNYSSNKFSVELVNNNPLTIQYHFYSHYDIPYLTKVELTDYYPQLYLYNKSVLLGFLAFPLFLIIIGWNELDIDRKKHLLSENVS